MNQGKQDVVKQEMTKLNIDILGVCERKWTGMSEFNSDDHYVGPPWWLSSKESACNAGDTGLIPGSGRSPGEENGNSCQYSCLANSMDRGSWQAYSSWGHKESNTTE